MYIYLFYINKYILMKKILIELLCICLYLSGSVMSVICSARTVTSILFSFIISSAFSRENKFLRICFFKFALLFRSLPGLHIQICQIFIVAIIIRQFHEFFESSIWQVFDNWPNCGTVRANL